MARSLWDNLQVLRLFQRSRLPIIAIAMGELGMATRILALRYRTALLTYAALEGDGGEVNHVAPGQISVQALRDVFLARRINPETQPFGLLDPRASRQLGELRHLNHGLRDAGIDGVCVPLPTDVLEPALLRAYVTQANFRGFFVGEELMGQAVSMVDQMQPVGAGVANVIGADHSGRLTGIHADNRVMRLQQFVLGGG